MVHYSEQIRGSEVKKKGNVHSTVLYPSTLSRSPAGSISRTDACQQRNQLYLAKWGGMRGPRWTSERAGEPGSGRHCGGITCGGSQHRGCLVLWCFRVMVLWLQLLQKLLRFLFHGAFPCFITVSKPVYVRLAEPRIVIWAVPQWRVKDRTRTFCQGPVISTIMLDEESFKLRMRFQGWLGWRAC